MEGTASPTQNDSMGFKDKQKALFTLQCLKDRDISYQNRVINSYYRNAKQILKVTKDDMKKFNIGEAIEIFEEWLRDYRKNDRGKTNLSYLPIETVEAFEPLAENYGISDTEFYKACKDVDGDFKALRTVKCDKNGGVTWDIERNKRLREILKLTASPNYQWFEALNDNITTMCPSKEHLQCILLAYSPEPSKLKALIPKIDKIRKFWFWSGKKRDTEVETMDVETTPKQKLKRSRAEENTNSEGSDCREPAKKILKKEVNTEKPESSMFGFKDKEKALKSIESLQGRDVSYQYHVISGLIKRAERVISCTKDEEKIAKIRAAIEVLENWITDYNVNHRSRENFAYLTLDLVKAYKPLAEKYGIPVHGFLSAYEQVGGDYKQLRSVKLPNENITWDVERNKNLRTIVKNIKEKHKQWFETDAPLRGLPTKEHMECIIWGFSHEPAKLKKTLKLLEEKL